MSRYVITISPDNGGEAGGQAAHTTVRVDTSTGDTRITELTVRSGNGGGLAPTDVPVVDLDLLVRALTPRQALAATEARGATDARGLVPEASVATEAAPAKAPARKAGRKKATPAKAAAKKATRAKRAAPTGEGKRAYRRMPDPQQVLAAYRKVGTVAGLADHFGVPRHTATSWARRLRQQGHAVGRG
jgi:hypothetical protein